MKIMRLSHGLGNAMFQYAAYLQLKRQFPEEKELYLDTIWYDYANYPFELNKIFQLDIDSRDIHKILAERNGVNFEKRLQPLRFWEEYGYAGLTKFQIEAHALMPALANLVLSYEELVEAERPYLPDDIVVISDFSCSVSELTEKYKTGVSEGCNLPPIKYFFSRFWGNNRGVSYQLARSLVHPERRKKLFDDLTHFRRPDFNGYHPVSRLRREGNVYFNIFGNPNDCEGIRDELLAAFTFPDFDTEKNAEAARRIEGCHSVALHARVGSFDYGMKDAVARGYYPKAVRYVKKRAPDCRFFVFSDDPAWCRGHLDVLGLSQSDPAEFIDWNKGAESFRDMQLISLCRHQIIPNSTFSWWGGYLNRNPDKIFVTPYATFPGTISF